MDLTKELEGLKNFTHELDLKLKEYERLDESAVKAKFDAAFQRKHTITQSKYHNEEELRKMIQLFCRSRHYLGFLMADYDGDIICDGNDSGVSVTPELTHGLHGSFM